MSFDEPLAPAKAGDRRRARVLIESAFASGRLSAPDRDLRLDQARTATTQGELEGLVRDLRSVAAPSPVQPGAPTPGPAPQPRAHWGASTLPMPQRGRKGSLTVRGPAAVAALGVVGFGALAAFSVLGANGVIVHGGSASGGSGPFDVSASPIYVDVDRFSLDQQGLGHMLRDLRAQYGSTLVGSAELRPGTAVLTVPVKPKTLLTREVTYRQREFHTAEGRHRAEAVVDLADVDLQALASNVRRAPAELGISRVAGRKVTIGYDGDWSVVIEISGRGGRVGSLVTGLDGVVQQMRRP